MAVTRSPSSLSGVLGDIKVTIGSQSMLAVVDDAVNDKLERLLIEAKKATLHLTELTDVEFSEEDLE